MSPIRPRFAPTSAFTILLMTACTPLVLNTPTVTYEMPLKEVQRPADVAQRWGKFTLQKSPDGYTYEDNLVQVLVVPQKGSFTLTVQNKTSYSMQFMWDQASYVGPDGFSSPVSSGETRCIQMGEARPPETIPANSRAILSIIPTRLVYTPSYGGGCSVSDFLPHDSTANKLEGKNARLILPLKVQDSVNEYTLIFQVSSISYAVKTDTLR